MRGLRLSPLLVGGGGAAPFVPASLFTGSIAGGFWDASDLSTLFQTGTRASPGAAVSADGDPVGLVLDKSGNNKDLVQATAGKRPLYKTSGGLRWLEFDGVDDCLQVAFAMGTTWDRISAIRNLTDVNVAQILGGAVGNECLFQNGAGGMVMFNATSTGPVGTLAVNTDGVVTERWAATCQQAVDNGAYVSTPAIAAINPGGLTVAASPSLASTAKIRWCGSAMVNRALTAGEIAQQRTFWGVRQGRVL